MVFSDCPVAGDGQLVRGVVGRGHQRVPVWKLDTAPPVSTVTAVWAGQVSGRQRSCVGSSSRARPEPAGPKRRGRRFRLAGVIDQPGEVHDDRLGHTHRRAVGWDAPWRPEWRRAGERCRVLRRSGARDNPWIAGSGIRIRQRGAALSTSTQPNIEATPAAFRAAKRLPSSSPTDISLQSLSGNSVA